MNHNSVHGGGKPLPAMHRILLHLGAPFKIPSNRWSFYLSVTQINPDDTIETPKISCRFVYKLNSFEGAPSTTRFSDPRLTTYI